MPCSLNVPATAQFPGKIGGNPLLTLTFHG